MYKWFFLFLCLFAKGIPLSISSQEAMQIGEKIWKNECAGTVEGLTHWNKGEKFPSLGIGHFIWYPIGCDERFEETFPHLLAFLQEKNADFPDWLKKAKQAPWKTREEFYEKFYSPEMISLRKFLLNTKDLQALFMANRLEQALSKIGKEAIFSRIAKEPGGLYALIDYVNFKGMGTSPRETYQGQGWGLFQVLERIDPSSKDPLADFVKAAKEVLEQRVQNSPPERNEKRWLPGWFNRLDSYHSL